MLNFDQIVMTIVIKALDFSFGQLSQWLKERRAKRKRKHKPKPRRRR
jgi:hypothetical protein